MNKSASRKHFLLQSALVLGGLLVTRPAQNKTAINYLQVLTVIEKPLKIICAGAHPGDRIWLWWNYGEIQRGRAQNHFPIDAMPPKCNQNIAKKYWASFNLGNPDADRGDDPSVQNV